MPLDLEAQSRQSLQAVGILIERLTPWLFAFGSWIFGGLIAFILLVAASLLTVGPVHPAILVSIAAFACALPLDVAGLFLLKLIQEMKDVGIDEHLLYAFQEADFPIEAYVPQEIASLQRRRTHVALWYSLGMLVFSLILTLTGMTAALWYMAWWVGIIFLVVVLTSQMLIILVIAHSLPPTSEEEKEQKRRYQEYRAFQRKGQRKAEQKGRRDENGPVLPPSPAMKKETRACKPVANGKGIILMARKDCRTPATTEQVLTCLRTHCGSCGRPITVAYRTQRTITTLQGSYRLILRVRRCHNSTCEWYHRPCRPEEEGKWALPHGEFGLDVIALVGSLRYAAHRSIPEIHQALRERGVPIAERTVTHLLQRYEELVALHLTNLTRLCDRFNEQGQVVLALDGLQPDVGHEVLWVVRDCLSGEVLLARSLLSACEADLANLLREVQEGIDVPIRGVISDGQRSIRKAVQTMWPDVPHQLCHFHYLREAAKPVYEADKHVKKELKKHLRGVRPLERAVEQRQDEEAEAIRGYCLAVRSALTDDGRPPLAAPGLKLHARISAIAASLTRVSEKGACRVS